MTLPINQSVKLRIQEFKQIPHTISVKQILKSYKGGTCPKVCTHSKTSLMLRQTPDDKQFCLFGPPHKINLALTQNLRDPFLFHKCLVCQMALNCKQITLLTILW